MRGNSLHAESDDVTMADNTLYCSRETGKEVYSVYKPIKLQQNHSKTTNMNACTQEELLVELF